MSSRTTRRSFLTGVGVLSATAAVATAASCANGGGTDGDGTDNSGADGAGGTGTGGIGDTGTVTFDGPHQAGITTPLQSHNTTVAFTLRDGVTPTAPGGCCVCGPTMPGGCAPAGPSWPTWNPSSPRPPGTSP